MAAQAPYPAYNTRQIIAILLHSLHNYTWMIASAALTGIIDAIIRQESKISLA